jgi:hypothetical protein
LGNYGGPTQTIPLLELSGDVTKTSPAVDAGDDALSVDETSATLANDQRGAGFDRNLGATVDIGAFEGVEEIVCALSPAAVSDEMELSRAILCFNNSTAPGNYEIEFAADITLTANLIVINNPEADISLLIDGAGFTLDGDQDFDTIAIVNTPDVTIDRITIADSGGDGIDAHSGNLRVSRSTILESDTNGIAFTDGELVVTESTLVNNLDNAIDGFGDSVPTSVTVLNTTITGNGEDGNAAIFLYTLDALLTHVTVYRNNSGLLAEMSNVTVNNSILAGNGEDCINFSGTVVFNNSLVEEDAPFDPCGVSDGVDGNIVGEDPFLGMLGNYGGPTQTFPPLKLTGGVTTISPVVDAGDDALSVDETSTTLTTDQRGAGFPRNLGAAVDMGAFEGTVEFECSGFPASVTDEDELNAAILCFGGTTTPGVYTIELDNDINLTVPTFTILNPTAGVSLVIDGNGNDIDGQGTLGVRPVTVGPDTDVTINGARITGGNILENGGGILNEGNLTLSNVNVDENTTDNDGGGIFNDDGATLAIIDSTVNNNRAIFPDGDGGGISNDGHMTITDSTISANTVEGDFGVWAGGVYNEGVLTITRSTIANNSIEAEEAAYGGGIANQANLIIRDSAITGNGVLVDFFEAKGGGIYSEADTFEIIDAGYGTQLLIINSTISANTVAAGEEALGGGLYATDVECCDFLDDPVPVTLINTTVAGNSAAGDLEVAGGGAYFDLADSNIGLSVTIHNSILADNTTDGAPGGDCARDTEPELLFESLHSLYEDTNGGACELAAADPDADGNIVGEDPDLGPLGNNGGPTLTHLPAANSKAVDSGDNTLALDENGDPLATDQRGFTPRAFNAAVDMGAVEVGASPPTSTTSVYISTRTSGTTGDGLDFGPEDIIKWDGNAWSIFFDGSAANLMPFNAKHNINAFWVPEGSADDFIFSFAQNRRRVPGIGFPVDGMDLLQWDGSAFSFWFDGSDVFLTNKTQEKIDALHVLSGSESPIGAGCQAYLLVSTQGPGKVPNHSGGQLKFGGEDVLGFCATSLGETTTGLWHLVLDGSAEGMPRNSTDSISLSADGQTLYLTTQGTFNVDAAAGGHSMVYAFDFGSGAFSGPVFSAPANGLPERVNGLQVEGDLN